MSEENTNTENNTTPAQSQPEVVESKTISYDDFAKIEMKLCKVLSAEAVPDSDKLIRFMLDCSEAEPRQILSAIREWYTEPEALVGKQMLFCTNLAPRKIRGLESQGMLMAVGEDKPVFLVADEEVAPGAKVR